MPEEICSLCHRHIRYIDPISEKVYIQGMCKQCERDQDSILLELAEKQKRIKNYLLGGDQKKPPA